MVGHFELTKNRGSPGGSAHPVPGHEMGRDDGLMFISSRREPTTKGSGFARCGSQIAAAGSRAIGSMTPGARRIAVVFGAVHYVGLTPTAYRSYPPRRRGGAAGKSSWPMSDASTLTRTPLDTIYALRTYVSRRPAMVYFFGCVFERNRPLNHADSLKARNGSIDYQKKRLFSKRVGDFSGSRHRDAGFRPCCRFQARVTRRCIC